MKKYIQTALITLVFCGLIFGGSYFSSYFIKLSAPMTQVEMIAESMQSVVAVYTSDSDLPASGFYIGNGIIVTAGHVADMEEVEKIIFEDGTQYPILDRIVDPNYDCGFLVVEDINQPTLEFNLAEVQRGEEIFILGHPMGLTFISTKGIVTGRTDSEKFFGDVLLFAVDAVAHPGNSGSVLLDKNGKIRGVHVGGRLSNCGSSLYGYSVNISTFDIIKALAQAGLEIE